MKRSRLADTLELIARKGADVFYTGELSLNIINKVYIIVAMSLGPLWNTPTSTSLVYMHKIDYLV